jgi:exosome complex component CSL4
VKCFDIKVGDIVYGQVSRIREEEAFANLIQINDISLSKNIEGTIRKEHVREKLVDQVVMIESFRPNDIIKAKVISLGDSSRSLYLTTAA